MAEINRGELEKMMNALTTYVLKNGESELTSNIMNDLNDMWKEARYKLFKNFEYDVKDMLVRHFGGCTDSPLYNTLYDSVFERTAYDPSREA